MKKINIIKAGAVTNSATFESLEQLQSWLSEHESMKSFGQPASSYQFETAPAVYDAEGLLISPAVVETINVPADYVVEIIDIVDNSAQEAINAEALAYLTATDFYTIRQIETGIVCPQHILQARQAARDRIVN